MIIRTGSILALHCHHCGKIQMHDISLFSLHNFGRQEFVCSCGQSQGSLVFAGHHQYLLDVPCILCETNHILSLDSKTVWCSKVEKIYCTQGNLEIGFIGEKMAIEQTIANYKHEFENENSQVMFEILNKVHDIAEKGGLYCLCGSLNIEAEVLPERIDLHCKDCGARQSVLAQNEEHVALAKSLQFIELIPPKRSRRKH